MTGRNQKVEAEIAKIKYLISSLKSRIAELEGELTPEELKNLADVMDPQLETILTAIKALPTVADMRRWLETDVFPLLGRGDRRDPLYFRLPKTGQQDPYWQLSRTWWNEHVLPTKHNDFKPPIKSLAIKKTGAETGVRLVNFASAKAFFERLEKEGEVQDGIA